LHAIGFIPSVARDPSDFRIVQSPRLVPFGLKLPIQLALITALPLLPFRNLILQATKIVL